MASIRKRTWRNKGGEQTAWVADYFDQNGNRHIKTFKKKTAANAWLIEAQGEVRRGVHTPENASITVAEAADIWIGKGEVEKLERSTLRQYRNHVDLHIKSSRIGTEKLARLSTPAIEAFRDDLMKKCSRPMARKVLVSLKSILSEAQRRGLAAYNPAMPVKVDAKKREKGKLVVGRARCTTYRVGRRDFHGPKSRESAIYCSYPDPHARSTVTFSSPLDAIRSGEQAGPWLSYAEGG